MSYIVGVVLLSAYSASLISFLAVQNSKPPFYTLEEMLSKNSYTLLMPAGGELYFLKVSMLGIITAVSDRLSEISVYLTYFHSL